MAVQNKAEFVFPDGVIWDQPLFVDLMLVRILSSLLILYKLIYLIEFCNDFVIGFLYREGRRKRNIFASSPVLNRDPASHSFAMCFMASSYWRNTFHSDH